MSVASKIPDSIVFSRTLLSSRTPCLMLTLQVNPKDLIKGKAGISHESVKKELERIAQAYDVHEFFYNVNWRPDKKLTIQVFPNIGCSNAKAAEKETMDLIERVLPAEYLERYSNLLLGVQMSRNDLIKYIRKLTEIVNKMMPSYREHSHRLKTVLRKDFPKAELEVNAEDLDVLASAIMALREV